MQIKANGIALHVEQRGAGVPAIVFLHYWGGSSRTWRHVVDVLEPTFRTVAIDHRGWGQSDAPQQGYALTDMADDAQAVIDTLGLERYILAGHSMGGKVAQLIASRHPAGLIGLALVAPAPPGPLGLDLSIRQGMTHAYDSRDNIIATVEQVLAPDGLSPADLEIVIADSLAGAQAAKAAWPLASSQEDITAAVSAIDVPVIVVSGENDRVDPPAVMRRELLSRIPQAQLFVLPKVGHLSPLEAPAQIADLINAFLLSLMQGDRSATSPSERAHTVLCPNCGHALHSADCANEPTP